MPCTGAGPHLATSGQREPRGSLCATAGNRGLGRAAHTRGVEAGSEHAPPVLNGPSVPTAPSVAVRPGAPLDSGPIVQTGSQQLSWAWEAVDADAAPLRAAAPASWDEPREASPSAKCLEAWAPPRGWTGRPGQGARSCRQAGGAEARPRACLLARPPHSCARLCVSPCSCCGHIPRPGPRPSSALGWAWQAAGRATDRGR